MKHGNPPREASASVVDFVAYRRERLLLDAGFNRAEHPYVLAVLRGAKDNFSRFRQIHEITNLTGDQVAKLLRDLGYVPAPRGARA